MSTKSLTTLDIEGFHALSHMKHGLPNTLEHARDFGRIIQESIKHTTKWSVSYYTHPSSYYPITNNAIKLEDIPIIPKPEKVITTPQELEQLRRWAEQHGKSVKQRSVRQDNCKFRSGTLPLNMYDKSLPVNQPFQFPPVERLEPVANELDEENDDEESEVEDIDIEEDHDDSDELLEYDSDDSDLDLESLSIQNTQSESESELPLGAVGPLTFLTGRPTR